MIWWVIILMLFVGILLILLEAIVPHGLSIIAGSIIIIGSIVVCFRTYGFGPGLLYTIVGLGLSTVAAIYAFRSGISWMALKPVPSTPPAPHREETVPQPAVGEVARVIQPLRPTGTVLWKGRRLPARSLRLELEIPAGTDVEIKGSESIYYLVEPRETPPA